MGALSSTTNWVSALEARTSRSVTDLSVNSEFVPGHPEVRFSAANSPVRTSTTTGQLNDIRGGEKEPPEPKYYLDTSGSSSEHDWHPADVVWQLLASFMLHWLCAVVIMASDNRMLPDCCYNSKNTSFLPFEIDRAPKLGAIRKKLFRTILRELRVLFHHPHNILHREEYKRYHFVKKTGHVVQEEQALIEAQIHRSLVPGIELHKDKIHIGCTESRQQAGTRGTEYIFAIGGGGVTRLGLFQLGRILEPVVALSRSRSVMDQGSARTWTRFSFPDPRTLQCQSLQSRTSSTGSIQHLEQIHIAIGAGKWWQPPLHSSE
ncbi:hypothetical protein Pelo_15525 [Pelomyxa schiedti]|nr:hypothetical protein Pelo_15525 [Pelomyxa schiedti]